MQFYEKLVFMMGLTQVSNRMLAQELQVDPSLISRLRTGARGMPRNHDQLKAMARYFAGRCSSEYQRQAFSEMLGIKPGSTMQNDQRVQVLYYWFCGDVDEVGRFVRTFETLPVEPGGASPPVDPHSLAAGNSIYYENEGKRSAARALYRHLLTLKDPCTLYLYSDEADDWLSEDYRFTRDLQAWAVDLLHRGFRFCHITPPIQSTDQAFDSLIRWTPVYLSGKVDAYFYPRLRDHVHRRTLVVAPGQIAMMSNSIAGRRSSYACILTTDHRLTQMYGAEFQDYLSLCRPMLNACTTSGQLMKCFTSFLTADGEQIHKVASLSAETAPPELMAYCVEHSDNADLKRLGPLYLQEMESSENRYQLIDIAYLASAEEVRAGVVPILLSCNLDSPRLYYTPETYVLHLKTILQIMRRYESYHFIPLMSKGDSDGILMVKENQRALLVRMSEPFSVFEITQPEIVELFREHLYRIADRADYTGAHRDRTISRIRGLIRELDPSDP